MSTYRYLSFEVSRGRAAWAAFTKQVQEKATEFRSTGGKVVGLFAPQLGFASDEAVVLLRLADQSQIAPFDFAETTLRAAEILTPTVRPSDGQRLRAGGIYVHRWFTIDGDRVSDFVDFSWRAWKDFEGAFDTEIFGLFTAEANAQDRRAGAARLLLLTWYRDHGVWEASREQPRDPNSLFAQRHLLTRTTIGRSSILVPLA